MPGSEGSNTEEIVHSDSDGLEAVGIVASVNKEGRPEARSFTGTRIPKKEVS